MRDGCPKFDAQAHVRPGSEVRHPQANDNRGQLNLLAVVLFFEIMLVAAVVVITWFALYALYRLITDES